MKPSTFQLPIEYCKHKKDIVPHIKDDLECTEKNNMYDRIFLANNVLAKKLSLRWNKFYTTNKQFLKQSQYLYKDVKLTKPSKEILEYHKEFNTFATLDKDIFIEKYQYIEFSYIRFLNNYSKVMQILSINNLLSPVLTILVPFIILFIPFLLIKLQKKDLSISTYIILLKQCFSRLPIGKVFCQNTGKMTFDKQLSIVGSVVFYVLQIYQNYLSCHRFYKNLYFINTFLHKTSKFIDESVKNIDKYIYTSTNLTTYTPFNNTLTKHKQTLCELYTKISHIKHFKLTPKNISNIGYSMKYFYLLFTNESVQESIRYLFDFNGYVDNIIGLQTRIKDKAINMCKFNEKKTILKDSYYIALPYATCKKNNININKNILITGPNAAGKTTLLKSTLFNILTSQQIGCGCYKSANIHMYDYFHCYLNIPDTSQRDSLFQSEARRCKTILSLIEQNKDKRHFCIFDELYSGTNPYEAVSTSYAYLSYLSKQKHIRFMITTHYIQLCETLDSNKAIVNKHMETLIHNKKYTYTYKLKPSISTIKGGVKVLRDLQYPEEIIDQTERFLENNS